MNHPWISWIYSSDSLRISPTLDLNDLRNIRAITIFAETPERQWVFQRVMSARHSSATRTNSMGTMGLELTAGSRDKSSATSNIDEEWSNKVDIFSLRHVNFEGFPQFPTIVFRSSRSSRSSRARHQLPPSWQPVEVRRHKRHIWMVFDLWCLEQIRQIQSVWNPIHPTGFPTGCPTGFPTGFPTLMSATLSEFTKYARHLGLP